jgi:hypothetical protein
MVKDDYNDDTKVAGDIIFYKASLKKKWQIIYKKSKPVNEEEVLRKKLLQQEGPPKLITIPFTGDSIHSYATGDDTRD